MSLNKAQLIHFNSYIKFTQSLGTPEGRKVTELGYAFSQVDLDSKVGADDFLTLCVELANMPNDMFVAHVDILGKLSLDGNHMASTILQLIQKTLGLYIKAYDERAA
jgi:hypothetical protein